MCLITWHSLPFTLPTWPEVYDLLYAIRPEATEMLSAFSTFQRWITTSYHMVEMK